MYRYKNIHNIAMQEANEIPPFRATMWEGLLARKMCELFRKIWR